MRFLIIAGLLISISCNAQKKELKIFNDFHSFFEQKKYDSIAQLLSPDFILINEKGDTISNKKQYLNYFSTWDNVFNTKWTVTAVKAFTGEVVAKEYDSNIFNTYIYQNPITYQFVYTLKKDQITQIKYDTLPNSSFYIKKQTSDNRFYEFFSWLKQNHPYEKTFYTEETYGAALRTKELFEVFFKLKSN